MSQKWTAWRLILHLSLLATVIICVVLAGGSVHRAEKIGAADRQPTRWSQEPMILAEQRGNLWINLENGREILADFPGAAELQARFQTGQSRSLSLASADFDEDGTPDIVTGYADTQRGAATFMRGNVDSVYPNSAEAKKRKASGEFTDTPFLSPRRLFALPVTPEFLASGDFDADGHFDLAAASRSDNAIYFLQGDGRGGFAQSGRVELPGLVTTLLADDFNRRDGLNDLIVAVQGRQDSQVLIFEHPYGAMKAQPEVFTFAAPIKALATGLIEGDARFDLAIAAGNELAVLRGRDRKLMLDESGTQAEPVQLTRTKFDFQIETLAVGDFVKEENPTNEIVLLSSDGRIHLLENGGTINVKGYLPAAWRKKEAVSLPLNASTGHAPVMLTTRVSARPVDTLVVSLGQQIHLLTTDVTPPRTERESINYAAQKFGLAASLDVAGETIAVLPLRLNVDALSDLVVMREKSAAPVIVPTLPASTFLVDSNANVDDPRLNDGICAINPCPIDPNLPCSGVCTYLAARQQANFNAGAELINFAAPSSIFIAPQVGITTALTIDGTTQAGGFIEVNGTASFPASHISGNGIDSVVFRGIVANGPANNFYINVGGGNSIVEGNRLGTNAAGTAVLPDAASGVTASSFANTLIGGTTAAARNIVSTGIGGPGVDVGNGNSAVGTNRVQGNFIGIDVTGTVALGNRDYGVIAGSGNILVGGTTAGAMNVISATTGNPPFFTGAGIGPIGGVGVLVQGNRIGTNANGTAALGNRVGIVVGNNGTFDTIGGTVATARNLISGNSSDGLNISIVGNNTPQVLGNFIGTNAAGAAAIPNGEFGLRFNGVITKITSNNVISGNGGGGMQIQKGNPTSINDIISNNLIGTDATGVNPLGNTGIGLIIGSGVSNGSTREQLVSGNTIAANTSHGILVDGGSFVTLQNNFIGTIPNLNQNTLANGGDGIRFISQSQSNEVGTAGAGNTIAFNRGTGVNLVSEFGNPVQTRITNNSIFNNDGLGIDLGGDGVTNNDDCDAENGINNLQNYPVLSSAHLEIANGLRYIVNGSLDSTADQTYVVSFYGNFAPDQSGFGEGKRFIGTSTVTVPAGCETNFTATLPIIATLDTTCIVATATDSTGNTSEFSQCVPVQTIGLPPASLQFGQATVSVTEDCTAVNFNVNRTGDSSNAVTVDYTTADVTAAERADYTIARGTLRFAAGETQKTIVVLINEDSKVEGTETASVTLSNPTNSAVLGVLNTANLEIVDDANEPASNTIDDPPLFVCQHYHDFLNREPDASGLQFWTNEISSCGVDVQCREIKRVNVSAAFFLSIEFQQTGYLVYLLNQASFNTGERLQLRSFLADTQEIGRGVVVGVGNWQQQLEANKQAFTLEFVSRPGFITQFPPAMTPAQFVDALNTNTFDPRNPGSGGSLTQLQRDALVNQLAANNTAQGRADVLRAIAENSVFSQRHFNNAFVYMQYIGYLRRNPNDLPDTDFSGYNFWLGKLNQFNGNFVDADMIKAFITSIEYRERFSQP